MYINQQSSAKITRKFSIERWEIFAVKQQIEFTKVHFSAIDNTNISLVQLKEAQKEIDELKRALKFYQIKRDWCDLLEDFLNGEPEVSRD